MLIHIAREHARKGPERRDKWLSRTTSLKQRSHAAKVEIPPAESNDRSPDWKPDGDGS